LMMKETLNERELLSSLSHRIYPSYLCFTFCAFHQLLFSITEVTQRWRMKNAGSIPVWCYFFLFFQWTLERWTWEKPPFSSGLFALAILSNRCSTKRFLRYIHSWKIMNWEFRIEPKHVCGVWSSGFFLHTKVRPKPA
jgi:hypothetical protein